MTTSAECTWGDGPDVLMVLKDKTHGLRILAKREHWASMGFTSQEARILAGQLERAAQQAEELQAQAEGHDIYMDEEAAARKT
jgi:hypothetical protein